MNIAIILEATLGGTRKHVVDLLTHLSSPDLNIIFIYSMKRADQRFKSDIIWLKEAGFSCIELPMSKSVYHPLNIYCIIRLIPLFRSKKIEVVHLHGAIAGAIGRVAVFFCKGVRKVIYSPHGGVMHKIKGSVFSQLYVQIEKLLISKKVFFVAVSSDEKKKMSHYLNIDDSRIQLIPNGINLIAQPEKYYDMALLKNERDRLGLKENDFLILYPALFLEAKGHMNFFNTFINYHLSLNSDVKILLAGDGPLRPKVQGLVNKLPFHSQVIFLGFEKNMDLYFQLANAIILPSLNEAFGYVLLEAMAHKKMIFATRVGGIKDIIEEKKNGFLYEPGNLSGMITDINYYNDKREELKDFGENAKEILQKKFDVSETTKQIRQLYSN